jgi:hypothetical protein
MIQIIEFLKIFTKCLKNIKTKDALIAICFLVLLGILFKNEVAIFLKERNLGFDLSNLETHILLIGFLLMFYVFFKDRIKKQKENEKDIFSEGIRESLELEYVLNDVVNKYSCDYVNVNLFHNGEISASGFHFKKMSCVAEGKRVGMLPKIQELQNRIIDPFKEKIAETKIKGYSYLKNLPEDKDPYFAKAIPQFGILSVFYVALFDNRKRDNSGQPHFVGFISFAWEKPTDFAESDLVSMMKERERLLEYVLK